MFVNTLSLATKFKKGFSTILFLLLVCTVFATKIKNRDSLLSLPMFSSDQLIKIEIKGDLLGLINDIDQERSYHDCTLKVQNLEKEKWVHLNVKIKTRGNFRLRKQNCNFPPLRFKIPVSIAKGTVFEGQNRLKYVSHCQSQIKNYDQHTIEEYLIYKMYNVITDHSYRVRLTQTTFIETNTNDTLVKYGFFLEDKDDVATRNGKTILNFKNIKQYDVDRKSMVMLSLFQLMIGNADWDVTRLHNIDVISVDKHSIPVAVPYDFDWSGIINHSYFTLSPKIDPDAKYKRQYKGMQWSREELENAFMEFKELRNIFLEKITTCQYLNPENRNKLVSYIDEFYHLINSKKDIRNEILRKSSKIPSGT
ncbi:hypothetical protein ACT3CE_14875 [Marinifilum sp. RC60d5]|uniref:hypothetical protein n=1 Tax=Marinifilum sp. RC60d5 TaxID=3458414 RepID=UPI0040367254